MSTFHFPDGLSHNRFIFHLQKKFQSAHVIITVNYTIRSPSWKASLSEIRRVSKDTASTPPLHNPCEINATQEARLGSQAS